VAPAWLHSLAGPYLLPKCFCRVTEASIDTQAMKPDDLASLSQLDYLTRVVIWYIDDQKRFDLTSLQSLGQVRILVLDQDHYCDDETIRQIAELPQLTRIVVYDLKPEFAAQLRAALPHCEIMNADEDWHDLAR
jgi:hypothetical protein